MLLINHVEEQASSKTFIAHLAESIIIILNVGEIILSSFNKQAFNYLQVFPELDKICRGASLCIHEISYFKHIILNRHKNVMFFCSVLVFF